MLLKYRKVGKKDGKEISNWKFYYEMPRRKEDDPK